MGIPLKRRPCRDCGKSVAVKSNGSLWPHTIFVFYDPQISSDGYRIRCEGRIDYRRSCVKGNPHA